MKKILSLIMLGVFMNPLRATGESLPLDLVKLSPGFSIDLYADGVVGARSMTRSPQGVIYVGTRTEGKVYALVDSDHDFKVEQTYVLDSGLLMPNGVAYHDGSLYVAEVNRILRYDDIDDHLDHPPEPVVVYDELPDDQHHGWKYLEFGPDGWLYFGIGAPCNACERKDERYASIARLKPDGSKFQIIAKGVRNTVGFDWHPETGELWFTDNGRDELGDNIPPDELNHLVRFGQHFGFPFCHGIDVIDPQYGMSDSCQKYEPAKAPLGPHVAALGMLFYAGDMFPKPFHNQIFIAEHGSWNRTRKIGYRIMVVELRNGDPVNYGVFASGWKQGENVWGRPVDLLTLPDGSLLVSDDYANAIYRISYDPDKDPYVK